MYAYSLFPFDKVPKDSSFVIYGAGQIGKDFVGQLLALNWGNYLIVDRRWNKVPTVLGVPVLSPDELKLRKYDYVVIAAKERFARSILKDLTILGINMESIIIPDNYIENINAAEANTASPWGKLSYSYHAEDLIVLYTFRALGVSKPSYMDVGASNPYSGSNTALMYKYGSRGINIEANPVLIDTFYRERPEDISLNLGVGPRAGTFPFYIINNNSGSSTLALDQAKAIEQKGVKITSIIDIEVRMLDSIVEEYAGGIYPDFLSIDIEGLDYEVLKSCNFSEHTPMIICCEVKESHPLEEVNEMMKEKGYELYVILSDDAIYLKKRLKKQLKILP